MLFFTDPAETAQYLINRISIFGYTNKILQNQKNYESNVGINPIHTASRQKCVSYFFLLSFGFQLWPLRQLITHFLKYVEFQGQEILEIRSTGGPMSNTRSFLTGTVRVSHFFKARVKSQSQESRFFFKK